MPSGNAISTRPLLGLQWEYAARAGTTTKYSFGDDSSLLGDYAWYNDNKKGDYAHIVGQKKPNPYGLYDMHGNVYEWVQDIYSDNYYSSLYSDPTGPPTGSYRVARCSWSAAPNCRVAFRLHDSPDIRQLTDH
jgi:formylglycine-generating enzyme required for sulfatase activity